MFTTYKNGKGIFDLITANWSEDQKKRAQEEYKKFKDNRPVVDDGAADYIPKSER